MSLAELLHCASAKSKKEDRYLFKGNSCFPISPCAKNQEQVHEYDQLFKILERYPNMNQDIDLSFITTDDVLKYLQKV